MSGLARLLLTRGIPTSGSELREWPALAGLRALGGTIHMRHEPSNLDGVDTVVYSTAIPPDHLELVEARRRGLRVLHRSEALAAAMTGRRTIAVAGTHGKTTTTSMVTLILQHAGLDPSFVIGGEISEVGSNAHHGSGEYFVAEADESDRSFLLYRPYVVDRHQHRRRPPQHLRRPGRPGGGVRRVRPADRPGRVRGHLRRRPGHPAARRHAARARAGGSSPTATADDADLRLTEIASSVQRRALPGRRCDGEPLGEIRLPVPGRPPRPQQRRRGADRAASWGCRCPRRSRRWPRSRACGAGSSSRAWPAGCGSTTSTPTTRPR